jgi:hypothetical protein
MVKRESKVWYNEEHQPREMRETHTGLLCILKMQLQAWKQSKKIDYAAFKNDDGRLCDSSNKTSSVRLSVRFSLDQTLSMLSIDLHQDRAADGF